MFGRPFGLLCVEMCLVWSCFGLWFDFVPFNLHVDVIAECSAGLLVCLELFLFFF